MSSVRLQVASLLEGNLFIFRYLGMSDGQRDRFRWWPSIWAGAAASFSTALNVHSSQTADAESCDTALMYGHVGSGKITNRESPLPAPELKADGAMLLAAAAGGSFGLSSG